MKRAEWLQETRKMRFKEAYDGWQSGRWIHEKAPLLLGVCERTFGRHIDRFEDEGLDGIDRQEAEPGISKTGAVDEAIKLVDR